MAQSAQTIIPPNHQKTLRYPLLASKPGTMIQRAQTTIPPNHPKTLRFSRSKVKWWAINKNRHARHSKAIIKRLQKQTIDIDQIIIWNNSNNNNKNNTPNNNTVNIKINPHNQVQFWYQDLWPDCCMRYSLTTSNTLQPWIEFLVQLF